MCTGLPCLSCHNPRHGADTIIKNSSSSSSLLCVFRHLVFEPSSIIPGLLGTGSVWLFGGDVFYPYTEFHRLVYLFKEGKREGKVIDYSCWCFHCHTLEYYCNFIMRVLRTLENKKLSYCILFLVCTVYFQLSLNYCHCFTVSSVLQPVFSWLNITQDIFKFI